MRELILQMQMTLDGYVGTPDGSVDWAFPAFDEEFTRWGVDSLWQAGVHVMGGVTGKGLAEYWPSPTEARDLPFAPPMNEIPKVVFSKTLDSLDWNQTRIAKGDLVQEINALKQEEGRPVLAHGGTSFAQSLSRHGLIDEYQLMLHPVALGEGESPFPPFEQPLRLELIEARPFKSGCVLQVYRPVKHGGAR
jgi:dihydrofolate reductase